MCRPCSVVNQCLCCLACEMCMRRDNLVHVLLLVDASLPPQQIDLDCAAWLAECHVPLQRQYRKSYPTATATCTHAPGSRDTLARPSCSAMVLMRLDLPTLERPMSANSGNRSGGQSATHALLLTKAAFLTRLLTGGGRLRFRCTNSLCPEVGATCRCVPATCCCGFVCDGSKPAWLVVA